MVFIIVFITDVYWCNLWFNPKTKSNYESSFFLRTNETSTSRQTRHCVSSPIQVIIIPTINKNSFNTSNRRHLSPPPHLRSKSWACLAWSPSDLVIMRARGTTTLEVGADGVALITLVNPPVNSLSIDRECSSCSLFLFRMGIVIAGQLFIWGKIVSWFGMCRICARRFALCECLD